MMDKLSFLILSDNLLSIVTN